jgi:triosephosphate isomerase
MLADAGVKYVVVGHSERRQYYGETNELVNAKTLKVISAGLTPIVCVGESLAEREQGITIELVRLQTKVALQGVDKETAKKIVIAYEPIWAIGTGKTATDEQAQEVCAAIRAVLTDIYGKAAADAIRIQYGGSVTAQNAKALFAMPDIDGGLVGGASLKPDFAEIVNAGK